MESTRTFAAQLENDLLDKTHHITILFKTSGGELDRWSGRCDDCTHSLRLDGIHPQIVVYEYHQEGFAKPISTVIPLSKVESVVISKFDRDLLDQNMGRLPFRPVACWAPFRGGLLRFSS